MQAAGARCSPLAAPRSPLLAARPASPYLPQTLNGPGVQYQQHHGQQGAPASMEGLGGDLSSLLEQLQATQQTKVGDPLPGALAHCSPAACCLLSAAGLARRM